MRYFLTIVLISLFLDVAAQTSGLNLLQKQQEELLNSVPLETIHIHTDRNHYLLNDTLWFKTYLMDTHLGGPSHLSNIIYAEIFDENGVSIIKVRQNLIAASSAGYIPLTPKRRFSPGRYYLYGYTQYLLNFGDKFVFKKEIIIDHPQNNDFIINLEEINLTNEGSDYIASFPINIQYFNTKNPPGLPLSVEFLHNNNSLGVQNFLSDSGRIQMKFPDKYDLDKINIQVKKDQQTVQFPLESILSSHEFDVQILPESGNFIEGITKNFGIKVLDNKGRGVDFEGVVENKNKDITHRFSSLINGIGRISLSKPPQAGDIITLTLNNGTIKSISFPNAIPQGIALQMDTASIHLPHFRFNIQASASLTQIPLSLAVIQRGLVVYGANLPMNQSIQRIAIDKQKLPTGILEFVVVNESGEILATRKVYNSENTKRLQLKTISRLDTLSNRSLASLDLQIISPDSIQAIGNYSATITDDFQVERPIYESSILTSYFLQSDIQGHIEQPGYYFSDNPNASLALDNLLITQGWVSYTPSLIAELTKNKIPIEKRYTLKGKALNMWDKGIAKAPVLLIGQGKKYSFTLDTVTNNQGEFEFSNNIPAFDSILFFIHAVRPNNKDFNIGVMFDKEIIHSPPFNIKKQPYFSSHVKLDPFRKRLIEEQGKSELYQLTGDTSRIFQHIVLDEVEIKTSNLIPTSFNPNGPGIADLVYTKEDFVESKYATLYDFLPNIKGLSTGYFANFLSYRMQGRNVVFIFDGFVLSVPEASEFNHINYKIDYYKEVFSQIYLDDVVGIEVSYNPKHIFRYRALHEPQLGLNGVLNVYIEITTRSGGGAFSASVLSKANFNFIRPYPFLVNKNFYIPQYAYQADSTVLDRRPTLMWEPYVVPDKNGYMQLQFYSSERVGNYTLRLEGMDENGNLLVETIKIPIKQRE